ncbi:MAG: transketolase family protein, partial [Deltaproteobacteria bacterium]
AFSNANVKIVGTHAGIGIGEDGYSQMGLEDIALMRPLPNMTIVQPADAVETAQAVEAAIRHEGPLFLRLTRQKVRDLHGEDYTFRLGEADPLRQGSDVAILATGGVVAPALDAADRLAVRGIQAEVTNIHTIQPIDRAYLTACARRFGRIVTVEDHNVIGGLGSAVCDTLAGIHPVPVERIGVEGFGESGDPDELYEKYGFTGQAIAERVERFLRSNG